MFNFRFQTYNGQYRKERRLDDGTVFGTYGWVDPLDILRLYDYIADDKGYRILKQKVKKMPPGFDKLNPNNNEIFENNLLSLKEAGRPLKRKQSARLPPAQKQPLSKTPFLKLSKSVQGNINPDNSISNTPVAPFQRIRTPLSRNIESSDVMPGKMFIICV